MKCACRRRSGEEQFFYVSGGAIEVQPHLVTVLADTALRAQRPRRGRGAAGEAARRRSAAQSRRQDRARRGAGRAGRAVAQMQAIEKLRKTQAARADGCAAPCWRRLRVRPCVRIRLSAHDGYKPARSMPLSIVILAAGQGKRMKSDLPKVLQPLAGQPLLAHVSTPRRRCDADAIHVVYGHGGEQVQAGARRRAGATGCCRRSSSAPVTPSRRRCRRFPTITRC